MRAYQIGAAKLPCGFNHSFQFISYEIKDLTREEISDDSYFWFPKSKEEAFSRLGEKFEVKDSLPQAALVWSDDETLQESTPKIIVDGNHRSTLFLCTKSDPEKLKVVIFKVSKAEYDYYMDLVHTNYLTCLYGKIRLEELRNQHLDKCRADWTRSQSKKKILT